MSKESCCKETGYSLVIATCPDQETVKGITGMLMERHLAACVQVFPIESVYTWEGKLCQDREFALHIKTRAELFCEVKAAIKENHPYEVPEIIQLPITDGLPEYLKWIDDNTRR